MFNLRKYSQVIKPTEKMLIDNNKEHGLEPPQNPGNYEYLLKEDRKNDTPDVIYEKLSEDTRKDAKSNAESKGATGDVITEKILDKAKDTFNPTRTDDKDKIPLMDYSKEAENKLRDAFVKENKKDDRDTEFWDKYIGVQLTNEKTTITSNSQTSQLTSNFDSRKEMNKENPMIDKPKKDISKVAQVSQDIWEIKDGKGGVIASSTNGEEIIDKWRKGHFDDPNYNYFLLRNGKETNPPPINYKTKIAQVPAVYPNQEVDTIPGLGKERETWTIKNSNGTEVAWSHYKNRILEVYRKLTSNPEKDDNYTIWRNGKEYPLMTAPENRVLGNETIEYLKTADAMLYHIYKTANGRDLTEKEKQMVNDINSGKIRAIAQMYGNDFDEPSDYLDEPSDARSSMFAPLIGPKEPIDNIPFAGDEKKIEDRDMKQLYILESLDGTVFAGREEITKEEAEKRNIIMEQEKDPYHWVLFEEEVPFDKDPNWLADHEQKGFASMKTKFNILKEAQFSPAEADHQIGSEQMLAEGDKIEKQQEIEQPKPEKVEEKPIQYAVEYNNGTSWVTLNNGKLFEDAAKAGTYMERQINRMTKMDSQIRREDLLSKLRMVPRK